MTYIVQCTLIVLVKEMAFVLIFVEDTFFSVQGTFPTRLKMNSNDLVCTDGGSLLREVFSLEQPQDVPLSFSSRDCFRAESRCESCFDEAGCFSTGYPNTALPYFKDKTHDFVFSAGIFSRRSS